MARHKNMAAIALVRTGQGHLYCRSCRSRFEESELREKKKSLRFCSPCWGVVGVEDLLKQREEDRMEVFYELGMFDRKVLKRG